MADSPAAVVASLVLYGPGQVARQHLVDDDAERVDVRPLIDRLAERLLRRHVPRRPHHPALLGLGVLARQLPVPRKRLAQLCQAEVEDLHAAVAREHDVVGLEVPVDDAPLVRARQAQRDLPCDVLGLGGFQGPGSEPVTQAGALHQLHREVHAAVGLSDVVDRGDVGVVDHRSRPRLADEPASPLLVPRHGLRQDLQRDLTAEPRVLGAVDDAHSPLSQLRHDAVMVDRPADEALGGDARARDLALHVPQERVEGLCRVPAGLGVVVRHALAPGQVPSYADAVEG